MKRNLGTSCAIALLAQGVCLLAAELPRYTVSPVEFSGAVERIVPADVDGDGLEDLVCGTDDRLEVRFQRKDRGFSAAPDALLRFSAASAGWDLDRRLDGPGTRVVALLDGREVKAWTVDRTGGSFSEPLTLLSELKGFMPRGVRYVPFVRDVNGDARGDLAVPGAGILALYIRTPAGTYARGPEVRSEASVTTRLDAGGVLTDDIGQSVTIPFLTLRDVNADGVRDCIVETEDRLEVYLARGAGDFAAEPTYALDMAKVREGLGKFDPDAIDFSNLTGLVALTCQNELADLTGDKVEDVLLRAGGKVSFFRGRPDGMDLTGPYQILKSGGNVVTALLHDEDDDGIKDLWLVRIEAVSLADVFLWLVVSGSVDMEGFLYRNDGARFSSRPARRVTLTISFPSIQSLIRLGEETKKKWDEIKPVPTERAEVAGAKERKDLLVLRAGALEFHIDAAGEERERGGLMELLGYRRDKDEYTLQVEEVVDRYVVGVSRELRALGDRKPDFAVPIAGLGDASDMVVAELNGDGRADAIVILGRSEKGVQCAVLLSGGGR